MQVVDEAAAAFQPAEQVPTTINQQQQKKVGMPAGLGLNLANVKREIDEQTPPSQH